MKTQILEKAKAENGQVLPKDKQKIKYFCKLCRNYGIPRRRVHLVNIHKANNDAMQRRHYASLLDEIFVECRS